MTEFYDSARYGLIPAGADAALYWDGRYAPPASALSRFGKVRRITVLGGAEPAAHAGIIDYESGNAAYEGDALREFALARKAMNCIARVYSSREDLQRVIDQVGDLPNIRHWVATLDGRAWSAADLLADIDAVDHVVLPVNRLWAVQYDGGPSAKFDTSLLYGDW